MNTQITNNDTYQYLLELLSTTNNTDAIADILTVLVTDKEKQEIINRLNIFTLLQKGLPQREISNQLGVGIATVSRGAKIFQQLEFEKIFPGRIQERIQEKHSQ